MVFYIPAFGHRTVSFIADDVIKAKEKRCSLYSATVTEVKAVKKRRMFKKITYYIPTVSYDVSDRLLTGIYPRTADPEEYHV